MHRLPALVALLALLLAPLDAAAQDRPGPRIFDRPVPTAHATPAATDAASMTRGDWQAWDWALGVVAGDLGTAVGVGIPVAIALTMRASSDQPANDGVITSLTMLAVVGGFFGNALGVWAYGEIRGFDGSYWWSVLGTMAGGLAMSTALSPFKFETSYPVVWVAFAILPSLGTVFGYWFSLDEAPVNALFGIDEHGLALGTPIPMFVPDSRGTMVFVPVLEARF